MIAFFRRGKALDDFIEGIRPELKAIPTPPPTDTLKTRIMESRASGVRNILPLVPEGRRVGTPLTIGLAVAAALILLLIPIQLQRSASIGEDLASPGVFGNVAFAQAPKRGDRPALAPITVTGGAKLRPLSIQFERRIVDGGGKARVTGQQSLQLSNASQGGSPVWRVVSVRREAMPTPHVEVESVYVAQSGLRLLRRTIHVSPYRRFQRINVWQQFSGDSVSGRMTTENPSIGAGRAFARQLPNAFSPVIAESMSPIFLMTVPLSAKWSGSASLLGWAVRDEDVIVPIEMRVESAETITVPAGRFDCWHLSLRFSGKQIDYWVRKSDGLGVRVLNQVTTNETREIVLTRVQ
jgi:hypothetical protein